MLILAFAVPESVVILAFIYLVWLIVTSHVHQQCKDPRKCSVIEQRLNLAITIVAVVFISALLVICSLFLMDVISAQFIAQTLLASQLAAAFAVLILFLYFKCKFATAESAPIKAMRVVDLTMIVWTISRVFQGWSDIFYERQMLGLIICVQQVETPINEYFTACGVVLIFVLLEIAPILLVIDKGFTDNFTVQKKEFGLREALMNFELEQEERSYKDNVSESSMINRDLYNSFEQKNYKAPNFQPDSDSENSQSFGRAFGNQKDFKLYKPFKKDERTNPLGELFKIKASGTEKQFYVPMIARVV